MNYGFLIRNDRCIGCHACSTACKSENQVPLGVHRTWVKNVETGRFPNVRRHFQVTRCNHCAEPPCVDICPTTAMYQRDDGIVEFDPARCIGCKACMQGCPYDAIHIDPESGTAAKCHFCAHRTELDLEPACVVVCPEHAIIAGDMDDPGSEISRMLARHQVTVRKPEQGTMPKLFYVDGEDVALHPTATEADPGTFAWADALDRRRVNEPGARPKGGGKDGGRSAHSPAPGAAAGESSHSAAPSAAPSGPIQIEQGRMAGQMTRTFYNVQHAVPWHWQVPAYLVTKGAAAGLFLLLALGALAGFLPFDQEAYLVGGFLSLALTGATTGLLVADLERPERFVWVLTKGRRGSWLVRGAWILIAFSAVVGAWWALEAGARFGLLPAGPALAARPLAFWIGAPLAVGVAVYTAFLFGQAEGRDLWQSTLLPFHLVAQAAVAGSAVMLIAAAIAGLPPEFGSVSAGVFAVALAVDLVVLLPGELGMPHASDSASEAAHAMLRGDYAAHFWWGGVVVGHALPLVCVALAVLVPGLAPIAPGALAAAGLAALAGLFLYEYAYVMAPQEVPNS